MRISVIIIALWNRKTLKDCIDAIYKQSRKPDEIIVVTSSPNLVNSISLKYPKLSIILIKPQFNQPHTDIVQAINTGIDNSSGDIIVFTENDVLPYSNWLERIEFYLSIDDVGGVGGPDEIWMNGIKQAQERIGKVGRLGLGKIIGGHNKDTSDQYVDFLKGCNMAIKRSFCPYLDSNLIGFYRWEQDICLYVRAKCKRLIYRNDVRVKHIKEQETKDSKRAYIFSYNTSYLVRKYLPKKKANIFLIVSLLWGDGSSPGFFRIIKRGFSEIIISLKGKIRGWKGKA
ncbi:glycosyltransferase family 2 protein [candidate division WOR-3 bacterium]|nr:glycosyltransferase family 2 protein [candidate division WOR-3 bacterium]